MRGPLLEETQYYPFGLVQQGISSKAVAFGQPENKKKFTGQELDDDLELNWYQFVFRSMDPQIGRFLQVDPLSDKYPYNSTYAYAENRVINSIDVEGLEAKLAIAGNSTDNVNYHPGDAPTFNDRAQRLEKIAGYTALQANTGDQIVNQMVEATKAEGSISSIVFFTHGTPQGLILDDNQGLYSQGWDFGNENSANVFNIKAKVASGEIKFTEDATIIFASCNSDGTMSDGLLPLAESFYQQLGVTVIASTGRVSPEKKNGKETGVVVSDGKFVKIEKAVTTVVSIPGDDGSPRSERKAVIGTDRTDLGKKIDPAKVGN
jgi:RHS repeat-associated protein